MKLLTVGQVNDHSAASFQRYSPEQFIDGNLERLVLETSRVFVDNPQDWKYVYPRGSHDKPTCIVWHNTRLRRTADIYRSTCQEATQ